MKQIVYLFLMLQILQVTKKYSEMVAQITPHFDGDEIL